MYPRITLRIILVAQYRFDSMTCCGIGTIVNGLSVVRFDCSLFLASGFHQPEFIQACESTNLAMLYCNH